MVATKHLVRVLLGSALPTVWAGGCFSSIRDPDGIPTEPNTDPWRECKNPEPPLGWHCADKALDFPTVACLVADIKACGNIGDGPTIFYSMGATTVQVREGFRDKLKPQGVMFNDALGQSWWDKVINGRQEFHINGNQARQDFFRNLFAIAMAQASSGEAFLVTKTREGAGGKPGIFQEPNAYPNIWRQMELPTLQKNPAITKITNVVVDLKFAKTTDWVKGQNNDIVAGPDIDIHHPPPASIMRDGLSAAKSCDLVVPKPKSSITVAGSGKEDLLLEL
ncbi:hypothetical protein F4821DRAFT_225183 [Hypoxylon rubiginosum]|uniref:Uncharacterized protein n=1 Tax=Hypoxylon rubiginosum TaxID=110542 RepID=A0ACC0DHI9_9PEZI|nr:hypothetical protein F4821DRAFT_225183 [Hypoxylon rubiginosum]